MTRPMAAAVGGVLAVLLAACGRATAVPQTPGASETASIIGAEQVLDVHANNQNRYLQTSLFAHTGRMRINLFVDGVDPHDLQFSDGPKGGTSETRLGETTTVLIFSTPGTYHFVCTIHPQMAGTLTITAGPSPPRQQQP